ncbi:MAG: 50S ribosomal protein L21 [Candidatus Nasuia deltocephalinicola]
MYFIVEILGKQYKIFKNLKFKVDKINLFSNSIILLNKILLFSSKKYFISNIFFLNKIFLTARILKHFKGKKMKILKFKRRKGFLKTKGFKKKFTELIIEDINLNFLKFFMNGSKKIRRFF